MGKIINFHNTKAPTDNSKAMQKWLALPVEIKEKIIKNVYCAVCGTTTIIEYTMVPNEYYCDVVLNGKCKNCGKEVGRLVEL